MLGMGLTSPEGSLDVNDRAGLLPPSTKASSNSEEDKSDSSETLNSSLNLSSRNLPPVYVDIQEEIEHNLTQIKAQSKEIIPVTKTRFFTYIILIVTELEKLHQKRLKESFFSEDTTLQMKIIELTREITHLIKQGEIKLKELCRAEATENSDEQSK